MERRWRILPPGSWCSSWYLWSHENPSLSANGETTGVTHQVPVPHVQSVTILLGMVVLCQCNGEWRSCHAAPGWARGKGILNIRLPASSLWQWSFAPAAWCRRSSHYITDYLASGLSNGEWKSSSWTCCQATGAWKVYIGVASSPLDAMEWTMEPGNTQSALGERVLAIIKDLPPFKLCL